MKLRQIKVTGSFSKAVSGAMSLNYGLSGGRNCSRRCRHHPESVRADATYGCYAAAVESRADRVQLWNKLLRHEEEMTPAQITNLAIVEVQGRLNRGESIPWFRFSSAGSVPMIGRASAVFLRCLRRLVILLVVNEIPIHFPVESPGKARFYRDAIGDLVTVRESLQADGEHLESAGAVSWVAGADIVSGRNICERRIAEAFRQAKERRQATGRRSVVCPAVVVSFRGRTLLSNGDKPQDEVREWMGRAKCGNCTACANPDIDIVYPYH